jgi:MazG family protein
VEAEKISKKAAGAGFEWPDINGVVEKLQEEVEELAGARQSGDQEHIQHEIGDLLFTLVNIARFLKVDPEQALRQTNARFRRRFAHVERRAEASGKALAEIPLERMEEFWQEAKGLEG